MLLVVALASRMKVSYTTARPVVPPFADVIVPATAVSPCIVTFVSVPPPPSAFAPHAR